MSSVDSVKNPPPQAAAQSERPPEAAEARRRPPEPSKEPEKAAAPPAPTVNSSGETIGRVVNLAA